MFLLTVGAFGVICFLRNLCISSFRHRPWRPWFAFGVDYFTRSLFIDSVNCSLGNLRFIFGNGLHVLGFNLAPFDSLSLSTLRISLALWPTSFSPAFDGGLALFVFHLGTESFSPALEDIGDIFSWVRCSILFLPTLRITCFKHGGKNSVRSFSLALSALLPSLLLVTSAFGSFHSILNAHGFCLTRMDACFTREFDVLVCASFATLV